MTSCNQYYTINTIELSIYTALAEQHPGAILTEILKVHHKVVFTSSEVLRPWLR